MCSTSTDSKLLSALQRAEELERTNGELVSEVQLLSKREAEHLEFSGRLTEKNGCLQAENSHLLTKVSFALLYLNTTISDLLYNHCTRTTQMIMYQIYWLFLDLEGWSLKATLVVLVFVGISSVKIPKAFLICSGAQRNFAYTFVLTFPTDLPSQILKLFSN